MKEGSFFGEHPFRKLIGLLFTVAVSIIATNQYEKVFKSIVIPNVVGMQIIEARRVLADKGLTTVQSEGVASSRSTGTVVDQIPRAGASVLNTTSMYLVHSAGPKIDATSFIVKQPDSFVGKKLTLPPNYPFRVVTIESIKLFDDGISATLAGKLVGQIDVDNVILAKSGATVRMEAFTEKMGGQSDYRTVAKLRVLSITGQGGKKIAMNTNAVEAPSNFAAAILFIILFFLLVLIISIFVISPMITALIAYFGAPLVPGCLFLIAVFSVFAIFANVAGKKQVAYIAVGETISFETSLPISVGIQ